MNQPISIPKIETETVIVPIRGITPLIPHRFPEKARKEMLAKQQGEKKARAIRDPQAEYEGCFYITKGGGYGFPATAFKKATVSAARLFPSIKMTELRQLMYFSGEMADDGSQQLVEIFGEPTMREDVVRVGQTTDLRYRPQFIDWSASLHIRYTKTSLSRESLLALVTVGGETVGVGDWRMERNGEFGMFEIDSTEPIIEIG